jgi:hypothetical protein
MNSGADGRPGQAEGLKMTSQKEIAKVLDRAAGRSDFSASSKQVWFLAGLIAKAPSADVDYSDWLLSGRALSKREASSLIDFYLGK